MVISTTFVILPQEQWYGYALIAKATQKRQDVLVEFIQVTVINSLKRHLHSPHKLKITSQLQEITVLTPHPSVRFPVTVERAVRPYLFNENLISSLPPLPPPSF